jgi:hypothetical protein
MFIIKAYNYLLILLILSYLLPLPLYLEFIVSAYKRNYYSFLALFLLISTIYNNPPFAIIIL